jgi:hypothetical protein
MSVSTLVNAMFFALTLLQIVFSLMGIIVSIGLLQLRESARVAAIFLSTVPAAILAISLLIFLGANSRRGREGMAAGYGFFLYVRLVLWSVYLIRRSPSVTSCLGRGLGEYTAVRGAINASARLLGAYDHG